jgi:predicted house-cleaning noncanonical NTP pyrophosphatase (MazG superfamily)
MSQIYNKLVRDKIPEIILSHGEEPITRILSDDEHLSMLNAKLLEEIKEYLECFEFEELADILEVIRGIAKTRGKTLEDIMSIMDEKRVKRGGFDEKIFLIEVTDQKKL